MAIFSFHISNAKPEVVYFEFKINFVKIFLTLVTLKNFHSSQRWRKEKSWIILASLNKVQTPKRSEEISQHWLTVLSSNRKDAETTY